MNELSAIDWLRNFMNNRRKKVQNEVVLSDEVVDVTDLSDEELIALGEDADDSNGESEGEELPDVDQEQVIKDVQQAAAKEQTTTKLTFVESVQSVDDFINEKTKSWEESKKQAKQTAETETFSVKIGGVVVE